MKIITVVFLKLKVFKDFVFTNEISAMYFLHNHRAHPNGLDLTDCDRQCLCFVSFTWLTDKKLCNNLFSARSVPAIL